jgi:hypothetical protein
MGPFGCSERPSFSFGGFLSPTILPCARCRARPTLKDVALGGADGEGSVGGNIFFHTEKWGPSAALSALLFLLGVFFLRQIFVSNDEKIGDKAH